MAEFSATDILNELLAAEQCSLALRLVESTVFVSRTSVADRFLLQRLAQSARQHCERLSGLILDLGGVPWPRKPDLATADLHYQELHHLVPRLEADLESLIGKYAAASRELGNDRRIGPTLAAILSAHRDNLQSLRTRLRPTG
jgi:hypothetical protein